LKSGENLASDVKEKHNEMYGNKKEVMQSKKKWYEIWK
jgi:hypothetical protein